MSNVYTLQSSEQDNTLIYLDEHPFYRYIPYYTIIVSVAKKNTSDFLNKMYYIFGEYKVQDSELAPLQARQTRQNSGGGCRFDKRGVTKNFEFLCDKNINFLEVLR